MMIRRMHWPRIMVQDSNNINRENARTRHLVVQGNCLEQFQESLRVKINQCGGALEELVIQPDVEFSEPNVEIDGVIPWPINEIAELVLNGLAVAL
ncbi:hypothetical protein [Paenibacillus polymyxa]|uniref:hypothetical protein n=1 Tax=Paenibacillus polymyxa TaxID=1406 RepID=UPI002ED16590